MRRAVRVGCAGLAVFVALALLVSGDPAQAGGKLRVNGKGRDASGLAFSFRYTEAGGRAEFDTFSYGHPSGPIDCFSALGRLVAMSGTIDEPQGGLGYFLVIADDHSHVGGPDEVGTWLSNSAFDCDGELLDTDPSAHVAERMPILRGKVVVKNPPN